MHAHRLRGAELSGDEMQHKLVSASVPRISADERLFLCSKCGRHIESLHSKWSGGGRERLNFIARYVRLD
jgi:hypothetical protein